MAKAFHNSLWIYATFCQHGTIEVKDELIGEALKSLPEKKRNVILLSFFLDMTDTEIAKYMNLVRSTIHHHRTSSLIALKKIMEEIRTGKKK